MEIHHHGIDIIRRPAVVVDDADLGDGFEQRLTLHLIGTVGIHHDENAAVVRHEQGILPGNECFPVLRLCLNLGDQLGRGVFLRIDNNAELLTLFPAQAAHAHSGAHGVQIGILVSHDEHMAALADQLHQRVGGDPGANLAAVIRLPVPSAVEAEIEAVLHHRLIAAPAQGHFNAEGSEIVALLKIPAVHAKADGDGRGQASGIGDLVDAFQQGKLAVHCPLQVPLFKNEQEAVSFQLPQQPVVALRPLGDGVVELGIHIGNGAFRQVFCQFLIVVNEDNGDHRAGADILVPNLVQLRQVTEIQHPQHGAPAVLRPDGSAVDPVTPGAEEGILWAFGLAGFQPVQRKLRQNLLQLLLHHRVRVAGQFTEPMIGPDNHIVPHPNEYRGQGAFPLGGGLHRIGHGLDIALQLPAPAVSVHHIQHEHHQRHGGFHRRQPVVAFQQRRRAEGCHHKKVYAHAGL